MPVETTWTSVIADLKNYLERGGVKDPTVLAQLPSIVQLGQVRLNREAKGLITQVPLEATLTTGEDRLQKPAYWRNTKSFNIGTGVGFNTRVPLFLRTYEYCRMYAPDPQVTGVPKYYADYDYQHWIIVPTPAADYPFEVIEDDFVVPIDDINQTNFWTKFAPDLLLHACLLECQVFLKNREIVDGQSAYYDRLLKGIDMEDELRKMDRSQKDEA